MAAALLVGISAVPTAARPQAPDTSNASLADTLKWLKTFLPSNTGATRTWAGLKQQTTASLVTVNGCNVAILEQSVDPDHPDKATSLTETFSFSDLDPSRVGEGPNAGAFTVTFFTQENAKIKYTSGTNTTFFDLGNVGLFPDQESAQRAMNAFQHAAQLCANAQPF
jgi:hypothetical protein